MTERDEDVAADAERWLSVQRAFDAVLELPPAERESFIEKVTEGNGVRAEVRRLLAAYATPGPFDRLLAELNTPPAEPATDPARIGVWQIDALIGRGGMGSVYRAERADGQFVQRAALKLLRRDVMDVDLHRLFLAERRILARIDHPGIARILDGGVTDEGRPWFALEYVEGMPIDEWCEQRALGVRERLALFREVAAAVAHAHAHLIVHGDIKPANILVTADGRARLLDFGIARLLDADASPDGDAPRTGRLLLTPTHASPEQLRGDPVSTASDVYQLGLLLFGLLTGTRPARTITSGAAAAPISDQRSLHAPDRPSQHAPDRLRRAIDDDLDTIVLAALHTDPERRYPSVERLSGDVQCWLEGRPITARPQTFIYRAGRFVRRNGAGVTLATALALSLIAFASVTVVQARRVEQERDRARTIITLLGGLLEPPVAGPTGNPAVSAGGSAQSSDARDVGQIIDRDSLPVERIAGQLLAGSIALRRADLARAAATGARILWVDDNPASNQYEIMLLRSIGVDVVTAASTAEGLALLDARHWDIVLSDMRREGRADAGIELLASLQRRETAVPLIFYVGDADVTRDRPIGSFGLTNRVDELIHLVFDVLERRRL